MKIIFLDIDGVLLTTGAIAAGRVRGERPYHYCIDNLNRIVRDTGAKIIVSSSWRFLGIDRVRQRLSEWGVVGEVIGVTPDISESREGFVVAKIRGDEIQAWLDNHPEVESFVILDDDDDMGDLMPYLVRTMFHDGLTFDKALEAVRIIGGGK